ncbi:MAG: hypothetical protein ACOC2E_09875 [Bacteroidota bacterium]
MENSASFADQIAVAMENDDKEALAGLLFLWEQQCGLTEPVYRVRTLHQIRKGSWKLQNGKELLEQALNFKIRNDLINNQDLQNLQDYFDFYPEVFGFVPFTSQLDIQTSLLAKRLLHSNQHDSITNLVLNLYAGKADMFFEKLKNGFASETSLGQSYHERVQNLLQKPEWIVGIHAGMWVPTADISALGTHPTLGLTLGGKKGKIALQSSFEFRFGKTPRQVFIVVKDTLAATRNYQGGSLGVDVSVDFFEKQNRHMAFFAGAGLDLIDLVENSLQEPERITFLSPEFRLGLQYHVSFVNRTYLNLSTGFSFLNHQAQLPESTQLAGNAVNIKLIFGFRNNPSKTENLQRMGIEEW